MALDRSRIPAPLASDLGAAEHVLVVVPARLAASPVAETSIPGVVVVTTDRLALVPGAQLPDERPRDPVAGVLADLWALVRPVVVEDSPIAFLFAKRAMPNPIAGRGRPAIEVPLQLVRRPFLAGGAAGWVGVEIALPPPDPRPPFALYVHAGARATEVHDAIERHRPTAPPRPELERPYALYHLFRPPPQVFVKVGDRRGLLELGPDGPTLRRGKILETLVPYESVTAVELSHDTTWRRGEVHLVLDDTRVSLRASREAMPRLLDVGRLIAEVAGAPVRTTDGKVAGSRVAWRVGWLGAAGAAAYEIVRIIVGM